MNRLGLIVEGVRAAWRGFVDLLMPPNCLACDAQVTTAYSLCPNCWNGLQPLPPAHCERCIQPLPSKWEAETLCLSCIAQPPHYTKVRAPYLYTGAARDLVLRLKNGKEAWAAVLARQMRPCLDPVVDVQADKPLIIPVPLHNSRLAKRGYNQSVLLARHLARQTGLPLHINWLLRHKDTRSSQGLSRKQRFANVQGAFRITPAGKAGLAGRKVVLVDDVLTSGATANACARLLRRSGVTEVQVLVFARVATTDAQSYLEGETSRQENHGPD